MLLTLPALTCRPESLPEIDSLPFFSPSKLGELPYFQATTIDAYRKIGSRNPKWDAHAERALLIYARYLCEDQVVAGTTNFSIMTNEFNQAVAAGCDDPLVNYAVARLVWRFRRTDPLDPSQINQREVYHRILDGLKAHPYPAMRQAYMYLRAAQSIYQSVPRSDMDVAVSIRMLQTAAAKLAEAIKDKADRDDIYAAAGELFDTSHMATRDRKELFDFLEAQFAQNGVTNTEVTEVVRANYLVLWAWDARGGGWADSITPEGGRLFGQRLAAARAAIRRAWAQDSTDGFACSIMINALAGVGEPWEDWFARGKNAEPGCAGLFATAIHFLQPEWGGSQEALLEFGRERVKEGNWVERVPLALIDVYDAFPVGTPAVPGGWDEVSAVFEQYLKQFPGDNRVRSSYCRHAVVAQQWELAAKLLDQMGDLVVQNAFEPDYFKEDVAKIASHRPGGVPAATK